MKISFSNIKAITVDTKKSWNNKCFLTFDTDWASDAIVHDTYALVSQYKIPSTWFITNQCKILNMLNNDPLIEVGIHPNFNELLNGKSGYENSQSVIADLMEIVPTASSVRSHSLTSSERLMYQFLDFGLTHISNLFIPFNSGLEAKPYKFVKEIIVVPHIYQDNLSITMKTGFPRKDKLFQGFNVFNFHPIHVFLNSENMDRYENTRHIHHKPEELLKHRYTGWGTRNRLIELLKLGESQ